ncbi:MAG: efflux RND transporter periplasmic adaptor subunit [bacterium]|nr:efflux RND transporter periplasmic adaptor subunit [bacterium]
MNRKILALLSIVLVLALSGGMLGCTTSDNANASTGEKGETETASKSKSDKDADGKDSEGKSGKDGEEEEEKTEEAVPVEVAALSRGEIESILRFSTNLEAESQVGVFSEASRRVIGLLVEEGDAVSQGQILLRLQDAEQRSELSKVDKELVKAQREYKRQQRLYDQKLISEQEFNDATYELEQLNIRKKDAQRELGYTEVRAPIAGTITSRMVNLGDQVQISQHLFDIIDFDSIVARIFVPEKHLEQLRAGLSARIESQSASNTEYMGTVSRIAPIVDPRSGTVKVTVDVGGQRGLRPGQYVDVDLVMATRDDAVLVPKRALIYDNDQIFVYRLGEERRVERVFLTPALADKNFILPTDGVTEGDQVVIAGQTGLKDGGLVRLPGDPTEEDEDAEGEAVTEVAGRSDS